MRYIFYYYNDFGTLILRYKDDYRRKTQSFMYYTVREAIQKFRRDNNLRYKHITVQKLF